MRKARINANHAVCLWVYGVRSRVDEQTQVPARSPFDDAATLDLPCREGLGMEPHTADARELDTLSVYGAVIGSGKGDARAYCAGL